MSLSYISISSSTKLTAWTIRVKFFIFIFLTCLNICINDQRDRLPKSRAVLDVYTRAYRHVLFLVSYYFLTYQIIVIRYMIE